MKRFVLGAMGVGLAIASILFLMQSEWPERVEAPTSGIVAAAQDVAKSNAPVVPEKSAIDQDAPYFEACARQSLNDSECVGRLIWFKATGGNERFHTYTFQQRIGVLVDWYRVLRADQRDDRFRAWGIINDPMCCRPGDSDCPAKSMDETYGFDWCPGDDVLLKYVGKPGYVDPACGLRDAPLDLSDPHTRGGSVDPRHSPCDLRFGTSTGALGFRKFPNPRFDAAKWRNLNGGKLGTWDGFRHTMASTTGIPSDERVSKLAGRFRRAAVFDWHDVWIVPYRFRSAESAGRSGASALGKHQGPDRQSIHEDVRTFGLGHGAHQSRMANVRAPASRCNGHLGDFPRSGQQPRDDQRDHQFLATADIPRRARHQMAQSPQLRCRARRGQVLVRAGSRRQMLDQEHAKRRCDHRSDCRKTGDAAGRSSHPERR
jgi:hypothetical protein